MLFATPGKDAETFAQFTKALQARGGHADAVTEGKHGPLSGLPGAAEHLPNAQVTFDRFHLMKLVNEAVDAVRKGVTLSQPILKKTRWLWLKNQGNLKVQQKEKLQVCSKTRTSKRPRPISSGGSTTCFYNQELRIWRCNYAAPSSRTGRDFVG